MEGSKVEDRGDGGLGGSILNPPSFYPLSLSSLLRGILDVISTNPVIEGAGRIFYDVPCDLEPADAPSLDQVETVFVVSEGIAEDLVKFLATVQSFLRQ